MTDADLRQLEREWDRTHDPQDGIAFYDALARLGPLPCPHCGGSESLSDLLRLACDRVPKGEQFYTHGSVALGSGSMRYVTTRNHEVIAGDLGSVETCARCGLVWNRLAPARAAEILREPVSVHAFLRDPGAEAAGRAMGDWVDLNPANAGSLSPQVVPDSGEEAF